MSTVLVAESAGAMPRTATTAIALTSRRLITKPFGLLAIQIDPLCGWSFHTAYTAPPCAHSSQAAPAGSARRSQSGFAPRTGLSSPPAEPMRDLAEAAAAQALVERAVEELGGLDLLVNAAGEGFAPKPVAEVTEPDWDPAFGATAKGSFFVTQAAAPHLRESRGSSS